MGRLIRLIEKETHYNNEDIAIIRYGLGNLMMKLYFLAGAVIIGICLGKLVEILLFLAFFIPMRSFAGGYHCRTRMRCAVWSVVLLFIAIGLMILMVESTIMNYYLNGMFVMSIYSIWFVAPVGTRSKPLDEIMTKKCQKKIRWLILTDAIAFLLGYVLKWELVENALCVAVFLVAIIVGWGYLANENIPSEDMR